MQIFEIMSSMKIVRSLYMLVTVHPSSTHVSHYLHTTYVNI